MAVTSGFFNSIAGTNDRLYDAIQMAELFDGIIRDGVYMYSNGNDLPFAAKLLPETPMTVTLDPGRAWFNHTWTLSDNLEPFTFDTGDGYGRYDAIVLDVDSREAVRRNSLIIVKGEARPTPVKPDMIREAEHNQYPLCYVFIPAGATTLSTANIEYNIGHTTDVPYVTAPLEILDPSILFARWETIWSEWYEPFKANAIADWDAWKDQTADEWKTFMQAKLDEFNAFITARTNEFNTLLETFRDAFSDLLGDFESQWDAWVQERNVIFNSWFNQVQIDWQTWFDSIKLDWDTWKDGYNTWWTGARDAFDAWLEGMKGVVPGDEYEELARAISDVNGLFTATRTVVDGVTYVDIVVPQGGENMYQNIRKTAGNTSYDFSFVAPADYLTAHVYRFTDAIQGISQEIMTIRDVAYRRLDSDYFWTASQRITLTRNVDSQGIVRYTFVESNPYHGNITAWGTAAWAKLATFKCSENYGNCKVTMLIGTAPAAIADTRGSVGNKQALISVNLVAVDSKITNSSQLTIFTGDNFITSSESENWVRNLGIWISDTDPTEASLWLYGSPAESGNTGFSVFCRELAAVDGSNFGRHLNGWTITYPSTMANYTVAPPGTIVLRTYKGSDDKVDKLFPTTTPSNDVKYVYEVVEEGAAQRQLPATKFTAPAPSLVMRDAAGNFNINAATANVHPVRLEQAVNMVDAAMAVEEFNRKKQRVIGIWGGALNERYWVRAAELSWIPTLNGAQTLSATIMITPGFDYHRNTGALGNWMAIYTIKVRRQDDNLITDAGSQVHCHVNSAAPTVYRAEDVAIVYDTAGNGPAEIWIRSNNMVAGSGTFSYAGVSVTVLDEHIDNVNANNSRETQIFNWLSTYNQSQGATIPTAGKVVSYGYDYTPQAVRTLGWNGYKSLNAVQQADRSWTSRSFASTNQSGVSFEIGLMKNRMRGGAAQLEIRMQVQSPGVTAGSRWYDETFIMGYDEGGVADNFWKSSISPMGYSEEHAYKFTCVTQSGFSGRAMLGGDCRCWPISTVPIANNGTNIKEYLEGITGVAFRISWWAYEDIGLNTAHTWTFPIETWGDMAFQLGWPYGDNA